MTSGSVAERSTATRRLAVWLSRLAGTLAATIHSRAELLALEMAKERTRVVRIVLFAVVALLFVTLGAMAATVFVIVLFWDTHRLLAIGLVTLGYFALAAFLVAAARQELAAAAHPFSHTVAQLKKDAQELL